MLYTKRTVLRQDFFKRPTLFVAEDLIGKYLIRKYKENNEEAYQIIEVEAYDGPDDLASHARFGKTARNRIMFGDGGYIYVYLVYGIHYMLNIVVGKKEYPAAILIRGVGEIEGPGRVTKTLRINKLLHEKLAHPDSGLWFEDWNTSIDKKAIKKTPRIGVDYAGRWAKKPYRFVLEK